MVPSDFADSLLRKSLPALLGTVQDPSMQATIVQSHRSSLFVLVLRCLYWCRTHAEGSIQKILYSFK